MDNRLFNVNGHGEDGLAKALELAFIQSGFNTDCSSWLQSKENGLVLCWGSPKGANLFPARLSSIECIPMVKQWLAGDFAKAVEYSDWCDRADHDGSNTLGWQVYVNDWGKVGSCDYAICAIKPAWCWHGK